MTEEQRKSIELAMIGFRQIECLARFIREGMDGNPQAADAIGGLEALCLASADRLDDAFQGVRP